MTCSALVLAWLKTKEPDWTRIQSLILESTVSRNFFPVYNDGVFKNFGRKSYGRIKKNKTYMV